MGVGDGWMDGWWAEDGWVNRWVNEAEIREGRLKLELNMMRTVRRAPGPSRHGLGNARHPCLGSTVSERQGQAQERGAWARRKAAQGEEAGGVAEEGSGRGDQRP